MPPGPWAPKEGECPGRRRRCSRAGGAAELQCARPPPPTAPLQAPRGHSSAARSALRNDNSPTILEARPRGALAPSATRAPRKSARLWKGWKGWKGPPGPSLLLQQRLGDAREAGKNLGVMGVCETEPPPWHLHQSWRGKCFCLFLKMERNRLKTDIGFFFPPCDSAFLFFSCLCSCERLILFLFKMMVMFVCFFLFVCFCFPVLHSSGSFVLGLVVSELILFRRLHS